VPTMTRHSRVAVQRSVSEHNKLGCSALCRSCISAGWHGTRGHGCTCPTCSVGAPTVHNDEHHGGVSFSGEEIDKVTSSLSGASGGHEYNEGEQAQ